MELTVARKLLYIGLVAVIAIPFWTFVFLKFADYIEDAWRNNIRKKKRIAIAIVVTIIFLGNCFNVLFGPSFS